MLTANPHLQGILFDQPTVIAAARQQSSLQQLGSRCQVVGGDFFTEVPTDGDLYILSQILHNWRDEECIQILHNCFKAMQPSSKLLILEQIIPSTWQSNLPVIEMDLMMLVILGGRERSAAEYKTLLTTAGFERVAMRPLHRLGIHMIEAQKV
jgi:hypothetical protein